MKIIQKGLIICMVLMTAFHSGCVKKYSTKDVIEYAKDEYHLQHVKAINDGVEVTDDDGYTDTLWTLYDSDREITFHVLDNVTYMMEHAGNYLMDDYDDQVFLKYVDDLTHLEYVTSDFEGLIEVTIKGTYKNKTDLKQLYQELMDLKNDFSNQGFESISIYYRLAYQNPIRFHIEDEEVDDGDVTGMTDYLSESKYESFVDEYLRCALDYNFKDALSEFTEEEIEDFIQTDEDVISVGKVIGNEVVWYDDITASQYYYGISFGTLYEILKKENIEVTGDSNQYTFVGIDGSTYGISYDYVQDNSYYYLKDATKVFMKHNFYNHFECNQIKEFTGLDLVDVRDREKYEKELVENSSTKEI